MRAVKVSLSIEIERPVRELADFFKSENRARLWMKDETAKISISGDGTQPGDSIEMAKDVNGRTYHASAVVIEYDWPDMVAISTAVQGTSALVANSFSEGSAGTTLWQLDKLYQFSGLMRLMAPLFRSRLATADWQAMQEIKGIAEAGA